MFLQMKKAKYKDIRKNKQTYNGTKIPFDQSYFWEQHNIQGLFRVGVTPSLATDEIWVRFLISACGRVVVTRPRWMVFSEYSDFFNHICPGNADICALQNQIWAASQPNQQNDLCAQQRLRWAWASAQSDQSSQCTKWVATDPSFLHADSEDSDQTGRTSRLICVFAGRIGHFVGFVMWWLICALQNQFVSSVVKVKYPCIVFKKYSSVFRENRCPPSPKPVYGGNSSHEAVILKIRSRSPKSNKLLILSD